jgi:hypothetical protein
MNMASGLPLRTMQAMHRWSLAGARRRFERAAGACEAAQHARLRRLLADNRDTAYGRAHGFGAVSSLGDWQRRVPVAGYEELAPWVERAAAGEAGVLTRQPVRMFERTSGSTAPNKLVPYTGALLADFAAATGPWLHDLYSSLPGLRGTTSYWSISPATRGRERTPGGIPIGFEDDTEYFGPLARLALRRMLAVPAEVARLGDMAAWSTATITHLAASPDLGLISIWHPSFFLLLLRRIEQDLDAVFDRLPPRRAAEVRARLQDRTLGEALWPRLALVSCWADAAAAASVPALRQALPQALLQPKGLLATEGVVSLPLLAAGDRSGGAAVAAVAGHLLEFLDLDRPARPPLLAHELREGAAYLPVISTGGGFYRYRLGDVVRVHGFYRQAPLLRFAGRVDQQCDLRGEKLSAHRVGAALQQAQQECAVSLSFALVAPAAGEPPRYRLYGEGVDGDALCAVAGRLETLLGEGHAYEYARALGQLGPLEPVLVQDGAARYLRARIAAGARAGDVKPTHLDPHLDAFAASAIFGIEPPAPAAMMHGTVPDAAGAFLASGQPTEAAMAEALR